MKKEKLQIVCNAIINVDKINEKIENIYNKDILLKLQELQKEFKKYDNYNIKTISLEDSELIKKDNDKSGNLTKIQMVIVNTSDMFSVF